MRKYSFYIFSKLLLNGNHKHVFTCYAKDEEHACNTFLKPGNWKKIDRRTVQKIENLNTQITYELQES